MSGSMEFLLWTKGPLFDIALAIFAVVEPITSPYFRTDFPLEMLLILNLCP